MSESTPESETPKGPSKDERGPVMFVDGAEFRTRDQLSKQNRERLSKKGLKPIEKATFSDIQACNRDHLRTYCGVYNIKKKEKIEMELDMARYVAAWHYGEPGYNLADYQPSGGHVVKRSHLGGGARLSSRSSASSELTSFPESDPADVKSATSRPETRTVKRARLSLSGSPLVHQSGRGASSRSSSVMEDSEDVGGRAQSSGGDADAVRQSTPSVDTDVPSCRGTSSLVGERQSSSGKTGTADAKQLLSLGDNRIGGGDAADAKAVDAKAVDGNGISASEDVGQDIRPAARQRMVAVHAPRASAQEDDTTTAGALPAAGTSVKQYIHARQASERYKAAYNGAGSAIVHVVENAAAYFEGHDASEVEVDKKRSYERYQFNVKMLEEIFDGPPLSVSKVRSAFSPSDDEKCCAVDGSRNHVDKSSTLVESTSGDHVTHKTTGNVSDSRRGRKDTADGLMHRIASSMVRRTNAERADVLSGLEERFRDLESQDNYIENVSVRPFQKLERAHTIEEIEKVRREFEAEHNIQFIEAPQTVLKRDLDRGVQSPVHASDLRIIKFA